jgi:hypothetical protein
VIISIFTIYMTLLFLLMYLHMKKVGNNTYLLTFLPYFNFIYFIVLGLGSYFILKDYEYYNASTKYNSFEYPLFDSILIYLFHLLINIGAYLATYSISKKLHFTVNNKM